VLRRDLPELFDPARFICRWWSNNLHQTSATEISRANH